MSYRHRPGQLYRETLNDLHQALSEELALWLNEKVCIDSTRLQGGDFFNNALARSLCQSCCMIVVYIPTYFDRGYTYCAREYRAMEALEKKRLTLLSGLGRAEHGLIIPIVCRGWDDFPQIIREKRQSYNFEPYLLGRRLGEHAGAREEIVKIARYVYERHKELTALEFDPCVDCAKFNFPSEKSILNWLKRVEGRESGFPG